MADETLEGLITEATNMDTPADRLTELAKQKQLQALVAANPATPQAVLTRLGTSTDNTVRKAVAQNPNTPVSILYRLIKEFPGEFLHNPIVPILNMTRPSHFQDFPYVAWDSLLKYAGLPAQWMQTMAKDRGTFRAREELWQLLQLHTMEQLPAQWCQQVHTLLKRYRSNLLRSTPPTHKREVLFFLLFVALFPSTSPMLTEQWLHASELAPELVAQALATNASIGEQTLATLSKHKNIALLCQVAHHQRTSIRTLKKLSTYPDINVRRAIAGNPHTPYETVLRLAADRMAQVRSTASLHPTLSQQDYEILILDEASSVRAALAILPHLSLEFFTALAADTSAQVRAALASNPKIPRQPLYALAHDTEATVRAAAAGNPSLPVELMQELATAAETQVRTRLSGNARLPEKYLKQLAHDPEPRVRRSIATHHRTPLSVLTELSQTEEMEVWLGLARNAQAWPELLERLALRGDKRVQAAVAAHKKTPAPVLSMLAQQENRQIWYGLLSNPHTPLNILERAIVPHDLALWLRLLQHPALRQNRHQAFLALLVNKVRSDILDESLPRWISRAIFQYYTTLPASLLEPFAASIYWEERYLTARHPHMSEQTLEQLTQDPILYVRTAASDALALRRKGASSR